MARRPPRLDDRRLDTRLQVRLSEATRKRMERALAQRRRPTAARPPQPRSSVPSVFTLLGARVIHATLHAVRIEEPTAYRVWVPKSQILSPAEEDLVPGWWGAVQIHGAWAARAGLLDGTRAAARRRNGTP